MRLWRLFLTLFRAPLSQPYSGATAIVLVDELDAG
jgi:hypothetical protein